MDDSPFELPIDGTLDLHTFLPKDVESVVLEYIQECLGKGILHIRIIHGKGTGSLRRTVHSILDSHPSVISYRHEGGSGGSWGATVADLRPPR